MGRPTSYGLSIIVDGVVVVVVDFASVNPFNTLANVVVFPLKTSFAADVSTRIVAAAVDGEAVNWGFG